MIERRQRRRRSLSSTGKIGKYSLEEAIRTQPTRSLYRSHDPFLGRKVAIKIIQLFDPNGDEDEHANEEFFSEAKAIGQLQHQNIVSVYDAGVGDYEGYIVMEYVDGQSLLQKLKNKKTLTLELAIRVASQICLALEYANKKGVVHRDIKPSNIMLTAENNVKVVDFGISVLSGDHSAGEVGLMGTASYIAPELVHGGVPSAKTDLYSLAVLMYEMILGRLPFPGEDAHAVLYKIINQEPEEVNENIPQSVKSFLIRALNKNPALRINSYATFIQQLNQLQEEIEKKSSHSVFDTEQLKQMKVFENCSMDILHELSACLVFEEIPVGELVFKEGILDEYVCLVQGEALLAGSDEHTIVPLGQWLTEKSFKRNPDLNNCKALTNSHLLRVSKSNLLESSQATQAYFFAFALDRLFVL